MQVVDRQQDGPGDRQRIEAFPQRLGRRPRRRFTPVGAGRGRPVPPSSQRPGATYPAIIRLWRGAWTEFVPFLDYDVQIRKIISRDQRHLGV